MWKAESVCYRVTYTDYSDFDLNVWGAIAWFPSQFK